MRKRFCYSLALSNRIGLNDKYSILYSDLFKLLLVYSKMLRRNDHDDETVLFVQLWFMCADRVAVSDRLKFCNWKRVFKKFPIKSSELETYLTTNYFDNRITNHPKTSISLSFIHTLFNRISHEKKAMNCDLTIISFDSVFFAWIK